jgi:predicted lipase
VSGFDVPLAQCMLAIANASYYTSKTLLVALQEIGISAYNVLDDSSLATQGLVIAHPQANAITVAFRGTTLSVQNGALDIDCVLDDYQTEISNVNPSATQGWEVADGFGRAFMSLESQLQRQLQWALKQVGSLPQLFITGHSLGGAMATIAASDLFLNRTLMSQVSSVKVITFAAPRSGNPAFATGVANFPTYTTWWSVQNFFDQIPHLPLQSMGTYAGGSSNA